MRITFVNALIFIMIATVSMVACRPPQKHNINYLNDKRDTSANIIWQNYEAKIQPGDRLTIAVNAVNSASALIYTPTGNGGPGIIMVDEKGEILYPQLGLIKAAGLTRSELRNVLVNKLSVYLKDPIVSVDFSNFKITVLGEVSRKGILNVPEGKISILEAIGQSGDITEGGQRDSVLVIREVNGKREFGTVNLLSNQVFKSPYYVLQQNDVVYVPLVKSKAYVSDKEQKPINFSTITSVLGIISTLGFLILNLARR